MPPISMEEGHRVLQVFKVSFWPISVMAYSAGFALVKVVFRSICPGASATSSLMGKSPPMGKALGK